MTRTRADQFALIIEVRQTQITLPLLSFVILDEFDLADEDEVKLDEFTDWFGPAISDSSLMF